VLVHKRRVDVEIPRNRSHVDEPVGEQLVGESLGDDGCE
jgi:hypothetical protein